MSDSVRPHKRQPTRLPRPRDSPGKNTGVGCHFLLQCMKVKSESEDAQSCLTLSDPLDCSPPGSSVHGIFQAKEYWSGVPLVITFLPRSKRLLISLLQSPSAMILEPPKIKSVTVSTVSPSICHEVMGPDFCASVQFSSVAQSCATLCDPMNCSTPGLPVHHQLPGFTQTHVRQVGDAIQPSHPLLSPSPPAPNPSQHQSLFQ